ncbi:class I SAM-dependent methyltransferase [Mycobacterium parmense]|uniref:Methyltransferase n=1 Tax=Mycobacterium parmense TaxID=185642 RepID=A0A7I7YRR7_9MYCO|nr:class I SAM-dependent methyltransferase [Mycobacterium parmense]MCV7351968.1 class I SAM-dependent methyltransferase [Mycobacterium parmense]ORW56641.1 methyltransferase [Mycobacterium parmense]BBZ44558.1 methyltransferase [Mycobacterium parmense]
MSGVTQLYEQSDFPIFQNRMYDSAEEARSCPRGDIRLVQDGGSGLVYNAAFQPELMNYDAAYQNEQAHSPLFKNHLDQVAGIVERNLGTDGLIEVGCGKAYFLELLQSRGFSIAGFDATYEGENPAVQRRYFDAGAGVSATGLILRHVLEHVQDPVAFLEGIRDANGGGLIYIEVPCFDWILRARAWFDIFYEHVNYFRLDDFSRIFGRVVEGGHLFGGQYLYVVADLDTLRSPAGPGDRVEFPQDFLAMASGTPSDRGTEATAVWGAASKGVIFSLLRERSGNPVDVLIDINPAKCNKYVPATGLRVMSPEEGMAALPPGSDICVMNSNYLEEIRTITGDRFNLIGVERD